MFVRFAHVMMDPDPTITPPEGLVRQLQDLENLDAIRFAYRAGADMELEACLKEIRDGSGRLYIDESKLRICLANDIWTARRSQARSQAERALILLDDVSEMISAAHENYIRRALERLRELEKAVPKPPTEIVFEGSRYTRADLVSSGDKDWGNM